MKSETNIFTFHIVTGNNVKENYHNKFPLTEHKLERIVNPANYNNYSFLAIPPLLINRLNILSRFKVIFIVKIFVKSTIHGTWLLPWCPNQGRLSANKLSKFSLSFSHITMQIGELGKFLYFFSWKFTWNSATIPYEQNNGLVQKQWEQSYTPDTYRYRQKMKSIKYCHSTSRINCHHK